jgi:RNA polymerase sigma factor (TIGR02999 family)
MPDLTRHLDATAAGDRHAAADLLPLVYDELRKLAAARMAAEAPDQTLPPTALVHEAYLRLVGPRDVSRWEGWGHFFAAAAEAMRRLLVDTARRKNRLKRGGDQVRRDVDEVEIAAPSPREDLLALDEALERLTATDRSAAELVKLRYFARPTLPEAAQVMKISPRSADRLWAYARAWLHQELRRWFDRKGRFSSFLGEICAPTARRL